MIRVDVPNDVESRCRICERVGTECHEVTHNILLVVSSLGWANHVNHSWAIQHLHRNIIRRCSFGRVRHCRTSDFVSDLSFPWSDNDGGSFWFSYLNKLSKSKSGRDYSDRKRVDTSEMSFLSAMTLLPFFVSSVRLVNVWRADFLMVSVMATRPFLRRSLTKASWRFLPLLYALQSVCAIADGMTSRVWSVTKSGPLCGKKGFFRVAEH